MKSLVTLFCILFSLSAFSNHEDISDQNQYGKIDAAYLNMVDEDIKKVQVSLDLVVANLDQPVSHQEGKIIATMIIMIEAEITNLKVLREDLESRPEIVDADVAPIYKKLKEVNDLIAGLAS